MAWDHDGGRRHAEAATAAYNLPAQLKLELMSLSENATYLVSGTEPLGVLRVYRRDYQTEAAKRSEILWVEELRSTGTVATPGVIRTTRGETVHRVTVDGEELDAVMFEFVPGRELGTEDRSTYVSVGAIAAKLHLQVLAWDTPPDFERMKWGLDEILGPEARWGDWRGAPRLDLAGHAVLEAAEEAVRERLVDYPLNEVNSGLVHGDLRSTNVLTDPDGELWVIDFDDSGFSWFLWDLASMLTFMEHLPEARQMVDAWLEGYTQVRPLDELDLTVIPDLVFARRLQVLGWLGSHSNSDAAREVGDTYAKGTLEMAQSYLDGTFLRP
jgi:Ser/Thr protein kinase RdoA (MazF antagonist)